MPDFLIHRDSDGQIMLAVPYAGIAEVQISKHPYPEEVCGEWGFLYVRQDGQGSSIYCSQADAERYLAEWREWWEHPPQSISHAVYALRAIAGEEGLLWLANPQHERYREFVEILWAVCGGDDHEGKHVN